MKWIELFYCGIQTRGAESFQFGRKEIDFLTKDDEFVAELQLWEASWYEIIFRACAELLSIYLRHNYAVPAFYIYQPLNKTILRVLLTTQLCWTKLAPPTLIYLQKFKLFQFKFCRVENKN